MKITLPYPPSANNFYAVFRGRKLISREGRAWIERCLNVADPCLDTIMGAVRVTMYTYRARKAGDIDSPIKHCLDILTKASVIGDDRQIVELHVFRGDDKANPRVVLEVTQVNPP